jgi:hypothetical protein
LRFFDGFKSELKIVSLSIFEMSVLTPFSDGSLPLRPGEVSLLLGLGLLNKLRGASPGSLLLLAKAYLRKSDVRLDSI